MIIYSNNSKKTKTDVSYVNCDLGGSTLLICLISLALILSQLVVSKVIFQIITLDSYAQSFGCFTQFQSCNKNSPYRY